MEQQPQSQSPYAGPERRRVTRSITPLSPHSNADTALGHTFPLDEGEVAAMVRAALDEDGAFNDITSIATVVTSRRARGMLVARGSGVVCGVQFAIEAMRMLDPKCTIRVDLEDGMRAERGQTVLYIAGHARGLLSAERVAVNFLMHLSGIATLTRKYVDRVAGTQAKILDTRKTIPGWRRLAKYAVRCGGGHNHRMDLASAVLIKDNHLAAVDGDVSKAIKRARDLVKPGTHVEVECDSIEQVRAALDAGADIILLDNMDPRLMAECVELARGRAITEASGGVTLDTVRRIAETGVDWISIGKLTHSAPSLDMALDFD